MVIRKHSVIISAFIETELIRFKVKIPDHYFLVLDILA